MFLRKSLLATLGIVLTFGCAALAQETQSPTPQSSPEGTLRRERRDRKERVRDRIRRHDGLGRRGPGTGHLMRELNLSEEQRQQSRAIMQRRLEATKGQREELFRLREKRLMGTFTEEDGARAKALHDQIRSSMEGVHAEMETLLTGEQKAKLEELKKARTERMEQRLQQRQQRLRERQERLKQLEL
jgi:Spy/CpxP family protein refolding chaperone